MAVRRAKLFQNGRSQAVRLPWDLRFEGKEVEIWRDGERVVLGPVRAETPAIGEAGMEVARKLVEELGAEDPEFAGMLDEAMRKLERGE